MKRFLALAVLTATTTACAAKSDYPTVPAEMDKLCAAIGDTPSTALPPRDWVWFRDSCECKATETERQAKMPDGTPYTTRDVGPVRCRAKGR